jgi:multiple sugar transport system ATP-binding protein
LASVTFSEVGKVFPDGTRAVDSLDLEIQDGEFMVLVGPSGCGKTTALRMVAGLEEISEGEILIGDQRVNDVEPRKRDIAMVFQNYALYPHMSVYENIAFPLRSRRMSRSEIDDRVRRTADVLGLRDLLRRRPRALSGGQRQRVAMGRAIVREPQVFLMDEPLSNLDAKLRAQMRTEISTLQRELNTTTIYVTHDQVEAMTMGTRIAVMRKGVLQQQGTPLSLYDTPANLFVGSFIGSPAMNLFQGRIESAPDGLTCTVGRQQLPLPADVVASFPRLTEFVGRDVAVGLRPDYIEDGANANGLPTLEGRVAVVETLGAQQLVHFEIEAEPVLTSEVLEVADDTDASVAQALELEAGQHRVSVIARLSSSIRLDVGSTARFAVPQHRLNFFALESGLSLA